MKNFKTPLRIKGSKQDLDAIIPDLLSLGYVLGTNGAMAYTQPGLYLVTNFGGVTGEIGYAAGHNSDREAVDVADKELVLALAAMVDDDEFYEGELVIAINSGMFISGFSIYKNSDSILGKIGKLRKKSRSIYDFEVYGEGWVGGINDGDHSKYIRKATSDEILDHFSKKQPVDKPIAYEVMKEFPGGLPLGSIYEMKGTNRYHGHNPKEPESLGHVLTPADVETSLGAEFFKPIYKPRSIKVSYDGGEMEVTFKDGLAWASGNSFTKEQLQRLIGVEIVGADAGIKVRATRFDFGCIFQYKGITAESIQKIIELI